MRKFPISVGFVLLSAWVLTACHAASPAEASGAHPYVGMWTTDDNYIRQELRADGRYDEARGERESAYTGRYAVTGDHIDYWDDTGFTADGRFVDGVLHHAGYVFYRKGGGTAR